MIEMELSSFLVWFALGGLGSAILCWLVIRLFYLRRAMLRKRTHLICRLCQLRYIDVSRRAFSACPDCGGLNQRGGQRRL